jgi:hypothetical protein
MFDFFYKISITQFIQNILKLLKIKYIIKIYYIINHILVKLINNFDIFLNNTSDQSCVKKGQTSDISGRMEYLQIKLFILLFYIFMKITDYRYRFTT